MLNNDFEGVVRWVESLRGRMSEAGRQVEEVGFYRPCTLEKYIGEEHIATQANPN